MTPPTPAASGDLSDRRCTARSKRSGQRCRKLAVRGATVCATHGGSAPQVRAAAARRVARDDALAAASSELARLGGGWVDVDPLEGLMRLYQEAEWNVAVYRAALTDLDVAVEMDGAIAIPEQVVEFEKGGTHVPAAFHILVEGYNRERDRAAKYAKQCLDAGVDERRLQVAEGDAQRFGRAFAATLDRLAEKLTPALLKDAQKIMGEELRKVVAA